MSTEKKIDAKKWFRANIKPYLKAIKAWVSTQIDSKVNDAKTELRNEIASAGSVTGAFKGGFDTVSSMPTGAGTKNGDWAVLKTDDGSNESGIYVKSASGWDFVSDITSFDEASALLATDTEFNAGTATDKAVTVKQLADTFAGTITNEEAQADWDSVQ
ncbi:MAG: hypothetical protein KGV56_03205 [Gammaproteobacteria bacterium]|nr:hypothetical protein [Gammaproteobacteria bacterium]